jgi:hypothetical protein
VLSTLLEKLGTLLPKSFVIANFFPMLLFVALNGLMLFWMSNSFRETVANYLALSPARQAFIGFPILIAITLAAYISSTLNLVQREILEGRHLPAPLKAGLSASQQWRKTLSNDQFVQVRVARRDLRSLKGSARLLAARQRGKSEQAVCTYSVDSDAAKAIFAIDRRRIRYEPILAADLEKAIALLADQLAQCPVDQLDPADQDYDNKVLLDRDHRALLECLEYAVEQVENDYTALFNYKEFNYSRFRLAPTAMGNIAESVRSYAKSRYSMNLDPFWSRLQKILVNDEKFYSMLVDAKTQLDFLISLFWVTVCFTIIWTVQLLYFRNSILAFLLVALGGPILSFLWYRIALQNYRAFADILRTSIDLYRFDLLDSFHIERPGGNVAERETWIRLNQLIGFGDADVVVRYHHSDPRDED